MHHLELLEIYQVLNLLLVLHLNHLRSGQLFTVQFLIVILTFLFIDFFDTAGTLVAVATQAGMMKDNKLPRAGRALFSDSLATIVGAIFGTTTTTSYIESTSGVAVGHEQDLQVL